MKYLKPYKIFESVSYYQDDINVDITSTVIDILQDLIDEGLTIQCFTSGYITLKQAGVKYTENDISLFIMANDDDDFAMSNWEWYKTLDYKKLIPYLERVINYIVNEEDRLVDIGFQWRPKTKKGWGILREYNFEYRLFNGEINKELGSIPDNNYETISMKFKLKK